MHKLKLIAKKIGLVVGKMTFAVALGFFSVFAVIGIASAGYLLYVNATLPTTQELSARDVAESSKIYSRDGTLLYEFHGEYNRTSVDLNRISPFLKNATIAIEDKDFYKHGAVSLSGIARAALANYKTGTSGQGGSTITQQFVKNALLDRQKSYTRKIREVLLSYKVESHFTKDQILEGYLNEIPYGRNAYGVEAASQSYFGKSANELSLAESAYLAALPQAPSYYSPTGENFDALVARKQYILDQMLAQGYINKQQHDEAATTVVAFRDARNEIKAPYFVSWIQNQITQKYGKDFLRQGGLRIYTTLDLNLQSIAEKVVLEGAAENKKYGAYNAALVAVEPSTGKILAMAGGKDYFGSPEPKGCTPGVNCKFEPNVNVATSPRQPGSSIKPIVYVTAFKPEFGLTPMSKVLDVPTSFGTSNGHPYIPRNYDGSSHGLITIRKALAGSLNVPAVRTLATVGVDNAIKTARSLGYTTPFKNCGLTLVLGGCEVKLVDHVGAFAVLANGGKGSGATPFNRIEDKHGNVLEEYKPPTEQAINPEAVYELTSIMTDDLSRQYIFGPKNPLTLPDRIVAAKTGTTQNWKDGWTLGFTPQLAAGVWAGNNDGSLLRAGSDGVFVAAPLWHRFMELALAGQPAVEFPVPNGIVQIAYDSSNKPASSLNKSTRMEPFPWYALPKETQISAAPKSLNKVVLIPASTPVPPAPVTPLTAPSNLPASEFGPPKPEQHLAPPVVTQPTSPGSVSSSPTSLDYGGLPQDQVPSRP